MRPGRSKDGEDRRSDSGGSVTAAVQLIITASAAGVAWRGRASEMFSSSLNAYKPRRSVLGRSLQDPWFYRIRWVQDTVKECGLNLKHLGLRTTEPTFVSCLLVVDFEHSFVHVTSPTNRLPDNPHSYEPTDLQTKRQ